MYLANVYPANVRLVRLSFNVVENVYFFIENYEIRSKLKLYRRVDFLSKLFKLLVNLDSNKSI